jgi:D-xylose transport system substrate-binding protein
VRNAKFSRVGALSLVLVAGMVAAACSSSPTSSGTTTTTGAKSPSSLSTTSFTSNSGKGKVAAIMPDTVSSTRYVEFDQPDITKALLAAGLVPVRTSSSERPRQ